MTREFRSFDAVTDTPKKARHELAYTIPSGYPYNRSSVYDSQVGECGPVTSASHFRLLCQSGLKQSEVTRLLLTQSGHGAIGFERARLDRPYGRVAAESAATEFDPDQSGAGARAQYSRL
jgi:hypothetical protein